MSKPKRTRRISNESVLRRVSSSAVAVTSESVTIPAGAAGAVVNFKLTYAPVADAGGNDLSTPNDTSIALTSTAFTTQVQPKDDASLSNGQWFIDPLTGQCRGKKADTSTSATANYSYFVLSIRAGGSASTTPSSSFTGVLSTLPLALYRATPVSRTDGQAGPLEANAIGDLLATLNSLLAGEDLLNNVMRTQSRNNATYISTATTTVVRTGSGHLHSLVVNGGTAGTIIGYDNTAASGAIIFSFDSTNALATYIFDVIFSIGLTIVTASATKVTVSTGV